MRFLNKIVFINSAHVRYAEIDLNGNVHLIGTQGVGKSTLLRALLFFYNADKQKLGIPREKKSFDDFYLEKANSYIVYEVQRDESAFCVLVSKSNGRACFHFIDAPYCKDWFIDEVGNVTAEMKTIHARLGGVFMSVAVDGYEQYRDIIYGNRQAVMRKELCKFNIAESSRYQNIPRSIQNVFLNSKLDADFIKDTIIQSMDGESFSIDLGYFRHQVSEFEQEYSDIGKWFEKNKRGECETRVDGERVVKTYRALLQLRRDLETGCKELNYAYRITCEQLPSVANEIEKADESLNTTLRLLNEENGKYNRERDFLNASLTLEKESLKKCKERRDYYESLNIVDILKKQEQESSLKLEQDSLEEKHRLLTSKFDDIEEKYKSLIEKVQGKLNEFRHIQEGKINQRQFQMNGEVQTLMDNLEKHRTETNEAFKEKLEVVQIHLKELESEKQNLDKEVVKLKYFHPLDSEIKDCEHRLDDCEKTNSRQQVQRAEKKSELQKLISMRDSEIAKNKSEFDLQNKIQADERNVQLKVLDSIDVLLSRQKGSLYEWLASNKPGWENDIGKIVDEESVLYNTTLSPSLDGSSSLFGVSLDLHELPIRVRTPEEIAEERKKVEKNLEQIKKNVEELSQELEKKNAVVDKNFGSKIKKLQDEIQQIEIDLNLFPIQQKRLKNELDDLCKKDQEALEKMKGEVGASLDLLSKKILEEETEKEKVENDRSREIKKLEKGFKDSKQQLQNDFNQFKVDALAEVKSCEARCNDEIEELRRQRDAELTDKNVDVTALRECETLIASIKKALAEIEKNKETVALYRRDKLDLFDRETEFREKRSNLELKLDSLNKKFEERRNRLNQQRNIQDKLCSELREKEKSMKSCVAETEQFRISSTCPDFLSDVGEQTSSRNCSGIINELRNNVFEDEKNHRELRVSVDKFRSRFSPRNTFKFRTELNTDTDYVAFAENLDDFLLNNKINDYRDRTSGRYTDILKRVAVEVGNVTKQKSEVDKIVHGVNRDFEEKNFAGVIKNISLKTEESVDPLMLLLKRIQMFYVENQYRMGELTIFSDGETENANKEAVRLLLHFVKLLNDNPTRDCLKLSDAFRLQFRILENDNDTGWIDKIANVGSEGTDILVKAMVNIMLINVFKTQISRKFGDFKLHCMMDEIGRLHPKNANGILQFANARNIYLINGSPTTQSVSEYRYTYLLEKNNKSETVVRKLMTKV
ncbi:MAG: ATP-binding protein [Bacteroidales bacterium]|nr:ATP-binding protein [Bacteroidales bacterium]